MRQVLPRQLARQAVIVLGMHRSGTSALTRVINLLGAALPGNLMPSTSDNEEGYWESYDFAYLNRDLLEAAGTTWHDYSPIPDARFTSETVRAFRRQAQALLEESFHRSPLFVLKDPRLCRLVPFWRPVLQDFGAAVHFVLILRHPQEVYRSLAARAEHEAFASASITSAATSDLVWLRYVLESEHQTRDFDRVVVTFDGLLQDWAKTLSRLASDLSINFPRSLKEVSPSVSQFISARHKRQCVVSFETSLATQVYQSFRAHADNDAPLPTAWLDGVRNALDTVEAAYAPLRSLPQRHTRSPWDAEVLVRVADRAAAATGPAPRVLYVSDRPETRGHMYRVAHHVAVLQAAGVDASWLPLAEAVNIKAPGADVVVVFRQPWNDSVDRLHAICRARGIPVGFDVDDLIFDPQLMTAEQFDYLRPMEESQRQEWLRIEVGGCRRTLTASDFAVVSTQPLADAVEALGIPSHVLPNGLDTAMIAQADAALAHPVGKPSAVDGRLRLGYASGTPTHQKDFAVVVPVLATLLEEQPALMLTVVGYLTLEEFPDLLRHHDRIEMRSFVPHAELFREYARFDVNLVPLECGNPFCEGKSELKYYEAALVQVPTVAAPTAPYRAAIKDGQTGYCARTAEEWRARLLFLISDAGERERLGRNARVHAIAAFGPRAQSAAALRTFETILKQFRN